MKLKALAAFALILGMSLATSAFAQGRHDEKPHGMAKSTAQSGDKMVSGSGGRHDEKPHGNLKKQPVAKDVKPAATKEDTDKTVK